jgi:hypothetical protein
MQAFSVARYRVRARPEDVDSFGSVDLAVPVVDGTPLFTMLEDRYPGVAVRLVAPPSRHWLGDTLYGEEGRAVVLDGECGAAGCCGVLARITLDQRIVVWSDFVARGRPPLPSGLHFEFDRSGYEAALAELMNLEGIDWTIKLHATGEDE